MSKLNKNILRSVLLLSYVAIIVLVTYGFGALYTYLNTGADRSKMLHTEIKQVDQYLPELKWEPLTNEGRPVDDQTLNAIENDYLDAWYVKFVAYKTNTTNGIDDYYTKSARKNIYNIISLNTKSNVSIEGTTLEHHPNVEFFSEDGQLVVITDHNVISYKQVFKDKKRVSEITEKSSYRITLLLEDGFWRIRHLVKIKSEPFNTKNQNKTITIKDIKGVNYYPQANPWNMFNADFNTDVITKDFELIKKSGLNSIRIFVPYEDFGKSNTNNEKLKKLTKVLDLAEAKNLKVLVTLFDFYGDYSVLNWSLTQRHAKRVVNTLKNHNALLAWDIKNEPNLDFESRGETLVTTWLAKMIDFVRTQDPKHAITIGWSNAESANILIDKLDFSSFHYYEDLDDLGTTYKALKTKIKDKPIVITEYGVSSYSGFWNPFGDSEDDQAEYHKTIQRIFKDHKIQFMSWTLYDFDEIPEEVVGRLPWHKNTQKHFGFINKNGAKKASFDYISKQ